MTARKRARGWRVPDDPKMQRSKEKIRALAADYCDGFGPSSVFYRSMTTGDRSVYSDQYLAREIGGGWAGVLAWAGLVPASNAVSRQAFKLRAARLAEDADALAAEVAELAGLQGRAALHGHENGRDSGIAGRRVGRAVRLPGGGFAIRYDAGDRAGLRVRSAPGSLGIL